MIEIATDGSASKAPLGGGLSHSGGWAWVADETGDCGFGFEYNTTISRMELLAAIKALEWVVKNYDMNTEVLIVTDSSYVSNCFKHKWYRKWTKNGWINSKGEAVANKDLWERLLDLNWVLKVQFKHVKGHQGRHTGNEHADILAVQARKAKVAS